MHPHESTVRNANYAIKSPRAGPGPQAGPIASVPPLRARAPMRPRAAFGKRRSAPGPPESGPRTARGRRGIPRPCPRRRVLEGNRASARGGTVIETETLCGVRRTAKESVATGSAPAGPVASSPEARKTEGSSDAPTNATLKPACLGTSSSRLEVRLQPRGPPLLSSARRCLLSLASGPGPPFAPAGRWPRTCPAAWPARPGAGGSLTQS
mmetsp:Transcript_67395/g.208508  ORF Transcript_67395/g.208508 Transcript_67395/m.208508 type:complete len:210 (+) Transcript_67395:3-632(+)